MSNEELLSSVPCHKLEGSTAQVLHEACAVCYEDMALGEEVRRLPCLHYFHRACIDRWLKVKATCPLDNLNIRELIAKQSAWYPNRTLSLLPRHSFCKMKMKTERSASPAKSSHPEGKDLSGIVSLQLDPLSVAQNSESNDALVQRKIGTKEAADHLRCWEAWTGWTNSKIASWILV